MNLQQGIMVGAIVVVVAGLAFIIVSVILHYRYKDVTPPIREVSKRRLRHMWVVDDDDSHVLNVLPKHPKRTEVQMYDEEQGGWLE
jgi:hypothetical protein